MSNDASVVIDQQSSRLGGISNDEYAGQANRFRDGRNLDIRTNSKSFGLSPEVFSNEFTAHGVVSSLYWVTAASAAMSFSTTGFIDSASAGYMYIHKSVTSGSPTYENTIYYGNKLLILSDKYIHSFSLASTSGTGYGLRSAPINGAITGWTGAAGWSLGGSTRTHSSGTGTLVDNVGTITTAKYNRLTLIHTGTTTGSCTITCGGATVGTLDNTNTSIGTPQVFFFTTVNTNKLTFTPTNTYNGSISQVSLYETQVEEEKWTFNNSNAKKPTLVFKGNLLIGDGYRIVQLTRTGAAYVPSSGSFGTTTYNKITIDSTETILGMFELGDQVVFFTDKAQYFWDGFNAAYDRRVPWDDTIVAVAQDKTNFYVVTKSLYTQLWKTSSGYDRILVQRDEATDSTMTRFYMDQTTYTNTMINKYGIKYFGGNTDGEINTYGAYNPGMPESLMKYITGTGSITALLGTPEMVGKIYYGWTSGSTRGVGYLDTARNQATIITGEEGLVWLSPIIGNSEGAIKTMQKLRLGYDISTSSTAKITVYAKIDSEKDRYTFKITNPSVAPTVGSIYSTNSSRYTITDIYTDTVGGFMYIGTQRTTSTTLPANNGTLTKFSGTGDATLTFTFNVNGRIIWFLDGADTTIKAQKRDSLMYGEKFNKIQFAICLENLSSVNYEDPRVFDFIWEYNEIRNDL